MFVHKQLNTMATQFVQDHKIGLVVAVAAGLSVLYVLQDQAARANIEEVEQKKQLGD